MTRQKSLSVPLHRKISSSAKMLLVTTIAQLRALLHEQRVAGKTIGLVPTMGALHAGHISLVRRSVVETGFTVVSDFVNPTQFNDKTDLANYPRDIEADTRLLTEAGANVLFAPSVDEMYPEPDTREFSFPGIDDVMEGAFRPGHFNGVCQIVSKLLYIVNPDRAYFGEKDFQQIAVVRAMVRELQIPSQIIACPIVREDGGLALSSRNLLLSEAEHKTATNISRMLFASVDYSHEHNVEQTKNFVIDALNHIEGLHVQYFEIVNALTLAKVSSWDDAEHIQGCITVFCGSKPIRLIDNICYK